MVQTQRNKRFGQNTTFYYYGFTNVLGQIRIHFSAKYITMNMFSNGSNSNCTHVPINIDWTDISRLRRKSNDRILFEFRDEAHFFINKSNSRKKSQLTIHFAKGTSEIQKRHKLKFYDRISFVNENHVIQWKEESPSQEIRIVVNNEKCSLNSSYHIELTNDNGTMLIPFEDFNPPSATSKSMKPSPNDLITRLLQRQELLSELEYKLRFFMIHQIEQIIRRFSDLHSSQERKSRKRRNIYENDNLMEYYEIIPFGSDVSGFGTTDSDLDLCLAPKGIFNKKIIRDDDKIRFYQCTKLLHKLSIMLEQSIKFRESTEKSKTFYLHNHFIHIQRIFRAFVPIIKCRSYLQPLMNIDISVDTAKNSGVQMAAYMYYCNSTDYRVRPFILILKSWAKHHRIVQQNHSDCFSSFQMTCLGLAFLQSKSIIPSINEWISDKRKSKREFETKLRKDEISELLKDFFNFMIGFDFWKKAFDLTNGQFNVEKPHAERDACCIINPFQPNLNICKTVSESGLERFLSYSKQSIEILDNGDGQLGKIEDLFLDLDDRLSSINYNYFY
ncbi:hypothetical protein RDWZM_002705 [Blomia tropicalis]|uniref:Poly(A) RNA polymerase mitochondrial-like central palm domain-containing protein n=1 Tax=Blomia tropicalis TaxID=40697 RepID=A0A9Q0ME06_BLOTA|nr:hypothetical protein RDWZM_002705 [Blomia tropicalis]